MKSSETSAKYSWPNKEQKDAIQDSGGPEDVDILNQRNRSSSKPAFDDSRYPFGLHFKVSQGFQRYGWQRRESE